MATEIENRCSICLDSGEEVSYIPPCFYQSCYTCILRLAENTPECPLSKRKILFTLHSVGAENYYIEHVIALTETPSVIIHQVTGDPRHPGIPELHSPEAPQPLAAGGLPRPSVSILQPDEWVMLFQKYPCLLDTLIPWVQTRLRQIFMNNWMEAAIVKDTDMDIQSNHVIDENEFTTVTFLQQLICAAVQRCKRQARLLLAQQLHLPAQVPALLRALQAAPRMRSPTPPSLPWVGILADPHLLPLPLLLECKEPQEPKESVPGPSISHWGSEPSPNGHSDPQRHGPAALQLSSQQEDGTAWVTLEDASGIGQIGIGPPAGACASPQRLSALESQLSK